VIDRVRLMVLKDEKKDDSELEILTVSRDTATAGGMLIPDYRVVKILAEIISRTIPPVNRLIWTEGRYIYRFDNTIRAVRSQLLNPLSGVCTSRDDTHLTYLTILC